MHRISLILNNSFLAELASEFSLDCSASNIENLVKFQLGNWMQAQCGFSWANGYIQYENYNRPDRCYHLDGNNHFVSRHVIEFFDVNTHKISDSLANWLKDCDLVLLDRSLFPNLFDELLRNNVPGDSVGIFGEKIPNYIELDRSNKEHFICIFPDEACGFINLLSYTLCHDTIRNKLDDIRKYSDHYLLCLDDERKELDKLEFFFKELYPTSFFHGLLYHPQLDVNQSVKDILLKYAEVKPLIIFLDVWLDKERSGFHVLDILKNLIDEFHFRVVVFSKTPDDIPDDILKLVIGKKVIFHSKPNTENIDDFKMCVEEILVAPRTYEEAYFKLQSLENMLNQYPSKYEDIYFASNSPIAGIREKIIKVSKSDISVLITGERGTGKKQVAKAIHSNSGRKDKPFVLVNCAEKSGESPEKKLFGNVREGLVGQLEKADGGTLFLEEIGDMAPFLQAKFLRVVKEKEFEPVGASKPQKVDVRIIAATNKILEQQINDLFVVTIPLPPLCERQIDIPVLADEFLIQFSKEAKKSKLELTAQSKQLLMSYRWPGNVKELKTVINRVVVLSSTHDVLKIDDLIKEHPDLGTNSALVELLRKKEAHTDSSGQNHSAATCQKSSNNIKGKAGGDARWQGRRPYEEAARNFIIKTLEYGCRCSHDILANITFNLCKYQDVTLAAHDQYTTKSGKKRSLGLERYIKKIAKESVPPERVFCGSSYDKDKCQCDLSKHNDFPHRKA